MTIGRSEPVPETADEFSQRRVEQARSCAAWTELNDDLDPQPLGRLVSASSGRVFRVYAGATFAGGRLEFAYDSPLSFVVRAGDVVVLEEVAAR